MFGFWPVYKRELKAYLQSPGTYIVLVLMFFVMGFIFFSAMTEFSRNCQMAQQYAMYGQQVPIPNITQFVIQSTFGGVNMVLLFATPFLAMRLISEEKSRGTFELLVTCPINDWSIMLGKYFALLTLGIGIIVLSIAYPIMVGYFGKAPNPQDSVAPDWNIVASCWIGLTCFFAVYAAFGLMASAMSENQIAAGMVGFIGMLLWFIISGQKTDIAWLRPVLEEISIGNRFENFTSGVLYLKDFAFFILLSFVFLFIGTKTLDARRWRL